MSFDELFRRIDAENDAALAEAEAAAAAEGEEPFDRSRLDQLLGEEPGSLADRERSLRMSYYVAHRDVPTLAKYAELRLELELWDGSQVRGGDGPFGE